MVLVGDKALVEACFSQFALNVPVARKSFWTHMIELLGDVGLVESHFSLFRDSVSVGVR
jgi:hypothetical protein